MPLTSLWLSLIPKLTVFTVLCPGTDSSLHLELQCLLGRCCGAEQPKTVIQALLNWAQLFLKLHPAFREVWRSWDLRTEITAQVELFAVFPGPRGLQQRPASDE